RARAPTRRRRALERAGGEGSVGHVAAGGGQYLGALQEGGGEVHPALVDEEAALDLVAALAEELLLPPGEEGEGALVEGEAQKAQVVDARQQDVALGRDVSVGERGRHVRGEKGVGLAEAGVELR